MRKMKKRDSKIVINVTEHIILKNFWEYYITDEETDDPKIKFALVMGHETELGDVYLPELQPYIISKTKDLDELAPAEGWEWI